MKFSRAVIKAGWVMNTDWTVIVKKEDDSDSLKLRAMTLKGREEEGIRAASGARGRPQRHNWQQPKTPATTLSG